MIPKEYLPNILGLVFAGVLWMTSLYQLEIIYIWLAIGKQEFEMPYFLWTCSLPMARDIFYTVNALAFVVCIISAMTFGIKRTIRRLSCNPS